MTTLITPPAAIRPATSTATKSIFSDDEDNSTTLPYRRKLIVGPKQPLFDDAEALLQEEEDRFARQDAALREKALDKKRAEISTNTQKKKDESMLKTRQQVEAARVVAAAVRTRKNHRRSQLRRNDTEDLDINLHMGGSNKRTRKK
jgi:hypothetical protein